MPSQPAFLSRLLFSEFRSYSPAGSTGSIEGPRDDGHDHEKRCGSLRRGAIVLALPPLVVGLLLAFVAYGPWGATSSVGSGRLA